MRTGHLGFPVKVSLAFLIASGILAHGSDQQKAEKRLRHIAALAVDGTPRAIVNQTMAEFVHADRVDLMRQRHAMNLDYGSLFIAHQLTEAGARMLDIAIQLQDGKNIVQIANERNANWKLIADAAKHLDEKIDDNIYRHFLHLKSEQQTGETDKYDPESDVVRADSNFSPAEIASARADYALWRDRGYGPSARRLDTQGETELRPSADVHKGPDRPRPF